MHEPTFLCKSHIIFLHYIVLILFYFIFLISFILFNYSFYFIYFILLLYFILLFYFINIILYYYIIFLYLYQIHLLNRFLYKMNLKYFFEYSFLIRFQPCISNMSNISPSEVRQIEHALNWSMEYALTRCEHLVALLILVTRMYWSILGMLERATRTTSRI